MPYWRVDIHGYRLALNFARTATVTGINSTLSDGQHILMWDFDGSALDKVTEALRRVQHDWQLPTISMVSSGKPNGFHAYCLQRHEWLHALAIVALTPLIDPLYVKWCAFRSHFTLRLSAKEGREVTPLKETLFSLVPMDVLPEELRSFVQYETWLKGTPPKRIDEFFEATTRDVT